MLIILWNSYTLLTRDSACKGDSNIFAICGRVFILWWDVAVSCLVRPTISQPVASQVCEKISCEAGIKVTPSKIN